MLCWAPPCMLCARSRRPRPQDWPSRNVTVVVPLGAGSASDIVARVVMEQVGKQVGQTFVIENRPGAGGTIGANMVAKAAPDGHTILVYGAIAAANALYTKLPYDTAERFHAGDPFGQQPLAGRRRRRRKGYKTLADLVAAGKAKPGALNYSTVGRRLGVAFRRRAACGQRRLRGAAHPVQGRAEVVTEIIAGRIDFSVQPVDHGSALIQRGQARRARGQRAQAHRVAARCADDDRGGLAADSVYPFYTGVYLPAKTPRAHRREAARRNRQGARRCRRCRSALRKLGVEPMPMTVARVRQVLQGRRCGERRAGEGGENPDAMSAFRLLPAIVSAARKPMVALISPPT